jgi:hypothetical protein
MRFDCPACGAILTVPAAAAGIQGPCPKCWQEIVSPDPAHGLPARLPTLPPGPTAEPETPPPAAVPEPDGPAAADSPAPTTRLMDAPAPGAVRRSRGWVLPTLLSALLFSGIGYFLGKGRRELPPPLPPPSAAPEVPPTPPTPPVEPVEPAVPTPPPAPVPAPVPDVIDQPDAENALRDFLEAPDWQSRGRHVLSPDRVLPAMEKHAAAHGDGPIATTSVTLLEVSGANHIFKVCTPAIPAGFPVAVTLTDEGPMIDWESFTGFHEDHFRKFLEGPDDSAGTFDLLVRPVPETDEDAKSHFLRYRLSVPMPDREVIAFIRRNSDTHAKLRAIFGGSGGLDPDTIARLGETGVPLALKLAKRATNDGRNFVEIDGFVALGWAP